VPKLPAGILVPELSFYRLSEEKVTHEQWLADDR
jgi:hypothetical protein